uniref:RING-type domain-containing protein n=1 Tax=Macrostomum lignano TaxID=282301 RepID=A0A1I8I3R2_9PLAT
MDPIQCEHLVASAAAEERTCPVCLEEIDCARVLDCGHCMCDTCAVRYCRNLLGRKRPTISSLLVVGPVACPKCRDVSLVALDSAKSLVGLPETGKLTALVSVCQGFVNNPSLFLGIEEDVTEDCEEELSDGEGGRITGDGDLEARLQARLQSAGQELSNLRQESRNLRQEIRAQASMAAAETETETENSNEAEAIDSLVRRLSSIFSGPADRLVRRQEAARLRLEAAWLRLRCLQFARSCYGNVGRGGEGPLEFRWPVHANFVSNDRVAVCDKNNCRVQLLSLKTGEFIQFMGSGCLKPRRILQSQNGKFYVCDENAACVKVFNEQLELVGRLGDGIFHCPSGIAETRNGHIVLSDLDHAFVVVISPDTGEIVRKFHTRLAGDDYIPSPHFVSLDDDDFILVSDSLNNTVKIFDPRGRISGRIRGFKCPRGLAVDHRGNLLVVNADTHSAL